MKFIFFVETIPVLSESFVINQIAYIKNRGFEIKIFSIYKGSQKSIHSKWINSSLIDDTFYFCFPHSSSRREIFKIFSHFFRNIRDFKFRRLFDFKFYSVYRKLGPILFYNSFYIDDFDSEDVLHAHFGNVGLFCSQYLNTRLFGKPKFIVSFHGVDIDILNGKIQSEKMKNLLEQVDFFIANSKFSYSLLAERIPKSYMSKIKILPLPTDTELFKRKSFKNKDFIDILFCGRLIELKGVLNSIEYINCLVNIKKLKNIKYHIIGDGVLKQTIIQKIRLYGLDEYIYLHGWKSDTEVTKLMDEADIFIFPGIKDPETGRQETQGVILQEAQAMQLPIVASNIGGVKYSIKDKITGFLIQEGDKNEFVQKLEFLIKNQSIRLKMGEEGRKFVLENFDNEVIWGEKYFKIINEKSYSN